MGRYVRWLTEAAALSVAQAGGKGANLARLVAGGFPVPEGFVLTTAAFRDAEVDVAGARTPSAAALAELASALRRLLADGGRVAVRSSATLEDAAETSFSGMLSTYTDLADERAALDAVRRCWASAARPEVREYMARRGLPDQGLEVAVVVQRMLAAGRAGVAFGRDPVNRYARGVVVEAVPGAGEGIVSGEVTPERSVFDPADGRVTAVATAIGGVAEGAYRPTSNLTDAEVAELARLTLRAGELFGGPQDVEWAYADGRFWVLQSRPIVFSEREERVFPQLGEHTVLLRGIGASPRVGAGRVRVMRAAEAVEESGVVAVVPRLTNDLALRLRSAAGVVADEGGATSHGANLLREFGVPCVLSAGDATTQLVEGSVVTVDGFRGVVYAGDISLSAQTMQAVPATRMKVFASVLVPEKAAPVAPYADGVSSLRDDYFLLRSGIHPLEMVRRGKADELESIIAEGLLSTVALFDGKPVWYKTMDAPTDEFRRLAGGENEPRERNPLLGWRGIGRELQEPQMLAAELGAVRRAVAAGARTVGVKLPFVRFTADYAAALAAIEAAGLRPHVDVRVGLSVETPAVAMRLADFFALGVDFVSVGLSDLTMCVLALDRESQRVADAFDPAHPAVAELLERIASSCRRAGVFSCAAGESARDPAVLPLLLDLGFDAVGASLAYFSAVKTDIARLEAARAGGAAL